MGDGTPPPGPEQPDQPPRQSPVGGADGLDPKVAGLLAYLLLGWIGGLIMFLTQKHPEVRFHGAQSILLSIALFVVYMGLGILSAATAWGPGAMGLWAIFGLLYMVLGLAVLALWVLLCVKGYQLEHFKLPIIGDIAEHWAQS